jgi:hypothetical protein
MLAVVLKFVKFVYARRTPVTVCTAGCFEARVKCLTKFSSLLHDARHLDAVLRNGRKLAL